MTKKTHKCAIIKLNYDEFIKHLRKEFNTPEQPTDEGVIHGQENITEAEVG